MKSYRLTIDLATLDHLGIGLYSNIPAVLSEAVANAWDADAKLVDIDIDTDKGAITVKDDGWGMTEREINNRFLKVGYRKREDKTAKTPEGRLPMGRKGIGKLALFSIANSVEVHSVKLDERQRVIEKNAFIMRATDIVKAGGAEYHPKVVPESHVKIKKGTLIVLRELKTGATVTEPFLRKRLSRRFVIIGASTGFVVRINKKPITVEDRDYFDRLMYIWCVGPGSKVFAEECSALLRHDELPGTVDEAKGYTVTGWVGTMAEHKSVEEGNNGIVILARGKVIHENILPDLKEGRVFSKYLIGELQAEFLDIDNLEDIATSDRQSIKESDQRFELLKVFVKNKVLNHIGNVWTSWRNEDLTKESLRNPAIQEWYESLSPGHRKFAKSLLGKIASFPVQDPEFRKTLYQHGILAFETLAAKDSLHALEAIETDKELSRLIELFKDIDDLEAVHYWQITKTRVAVLQKFEQITSTARESVIRDFIFDHLWLLDTSWERASTDKRVEQSVTKEWKKIDARLTPEEKAARIDIRYRTAAKKHIIIELKKYNRKVHTEELSTQVRKYKSALTKVLKKVYPDEPSIIEAICIVGDRPEPQDSDEENRRILAASGARYITYDQLITQTRQSYTDYLKVNEKLSDILRIVNRV